MSTNKLKLKAKKLRMLLAVLGSCCLSAAMTAVSASGDAAQPSWQRGAGSIRVDVVENASRFVFDDAPMFEEDGMPAHGNSFITQGYIYPDGFLDDQEGVDESGKPTRPDLVLGEWTCRGFFIGDGAHTQTGPIVITTQVFDFYKEPGWDPDLDKKSGARTLITEGYELIDVGVPGKRAITGGTGPYRKARGEAVQTFLGFENPEVMNVKQRHRIKVRR